MHAVASMLSGLWGETSGSGMYLLGRRGGPRLMSKLAVKGYGGISKRASSRQTGRHSGSLAYTKLGKYGV